MRVIDLVVAILKVEGVHNLSCYPTTPIIDAASDCGLRPILCRQERVGVGIADGLSRLAEDGAFGTFAMQYGPGAENAFAGVASAYSDGIPILILPMGNALDRAQIRPLFNSVRSYSSIVKLTESIVRPDLAIAAMRRAISALKNGSPGPALVEIPLDVAQQPAPEPIESYGRVVVARSQGSTDDIERALDAILAAQNPVIYAGQGVLQAGATAELTEFAELTAIPVATSLGGKSAISEDHPLSLGTASVVAPDAVVTFLEEADLVFAVGASLTPHFLAIQIPGRTRVVHATSNPEDLNKGHALVCGIVGDAKLVLRQLCEAASERKLDRRADRARQVADRVTRIRRSWLAKWNPLLISEEVPISPYRVIHEFSTWADRAHTIVTHDSGSPRDQLVPFYRATSPRSYLGWGKSHALGSSLGLIMGAKIAAPNQFAIHFLGDAAFGMTGLDLETAARNSIPIVSVVLNNGTMAIESTSLISSHLRYQTRNIGGNYASIAQALGVRARQVSKPEELIPAFDWAREVTDSGNPALIEVMTSAETRFSNRRTVSVPHF